MLLYFCFIDYNDIFFLLMYLPLIYFNIYQSYILFCQLDNEQKVSHIFV